MADLNGSKRPTCDCRGGYDLCSYVVVVLNSSSKITSLDWSSSITLTTHTHSQCFLTLTLTLTTHTQCTGDCRLNVCIYSFCYTPSSSTIESVDEDITFCLSVRSFVRTDLVSTRERLKHDVPGFMRFSMSTAGRVHVVNASRRRRRLPSSFI